MNIDYFNRYPDLFVGMDEDDVVIFRIFLKEISSLCGFDIINLRDTIIKILHTIYPDIQSIKNSIGLVDYEKISLRLINDTCILLSSKDGAGDVCFQGVGKFEKLQAYRKFIDAEKEREKYRKYHQTSLLVIAEVVTADEEAEILKEKYYPKVIDHLSNGSLSIIAEKNITYNGYLATSFEEQLMSLINKAKNQTQSELVEAFAKLNPKEKKTKSKNGNIACSPKVSSVDIVFCIVDRLFRGVSWDGYINEVIPELVGRKIISSIPKKSTLNNKSTSADLSVILQWLLAISSRSLSINNGFDILVYSSEEENRHTEKDLGFLIIALRGRFLKMISGAYVCTDTSRYVGLDNSHKIIDEFKPELDKLFVRVSEESERKPIVNRDDDILATAMKLKKEASVIDRYVATRDVDKIIGNISARGSKNKEGDVTKVAIANEIYAKLLVYNIQIECDMDRKREMMERND